MTVFYADDDVEDCDLFTEALQQIDSEVKCITAKDGKEALDFLKLTYDLPDYIFLDINMPRKPACVRSKRIRGSRRSP